MRRFCLFGMALVLFAAAARAEDAADRPYLVLNSGGHTAPITRVLFSKDGKEVLTVSQDRTVRRWDAATGERLGVLRLPAAAADLGKLGAGAFSPDGQTLAVGGASYKNDGKGVNLIYLIDLAAGRVSAALHRPGGEVHALAFSHDGKRLAAGVFGQVYLLDVASDQVLHTLKGPDVETSWVEGLAFSPDDKLLALHAGNQANATLWSVETGAEVCPPIRKAPIHCLTWKDDDTLATGEGEFGGISLWDRHGKLLRHYDRLPGNPQYITAVTFLPGNKELYYSRFNFFGDAWEYRWTAGAVLNLASPEKSREGYGVGHHDVPTSSAVSPDGRLAATSDGYGVNLWTIKDGKLIRRLAGRGQSPFGAGWPPDGRVVGWTNGNRKDPLQRAFNLDELHFAKKPDAKFVRAAHTQKSDKFGELRTDMPPDQFLVKVLSSNSKFGVLATIKTNHNIGCHCYTFLPGDRLALGLYDNVLVYDAPTGKLLHTLRGASGIIWDLAPSPDGRYLLGAFSDQTLRVWDPDQGRLLLSLFVAGADWVVWTPQGYYAASPAGERLMGWQVNSGLEQLGTFHPASEFHKAFYRPDVVSRVLAEGSVAKALEAADKANGTTTQAVDVAQALPPEVSIISPAAGKLDNAAVEVRAQAQGKDRPVLSLRLLLDGRPCPGAEVKSFPGAKPGDKQEAAWSVTLPEGEHTLAARAESDVSAAASPEVAVSYQTAQEPLPTLYVLAVGINAYPGSLKLNWAVDDATSVARAFQADAAPKPYGKVEAKLLLDKDASKEGILAGLDWLKERMAAGGGDDTAVVFYAGHGHRDKKTGQFYMLPQDVDVSDLPKTGVTGTQLKEKLKAAPGRVLVLLDACHSGSIGQSPADPGSLTDDVQRQLAAPDCGVVVMCAAMAQEEAGEAAAVKHGFFTAALLSGLGGGAPPSRDGLIHLTALNFYVEEEVSELSKDEQHVVVDRPSTVTSFPLVKPPAKADDK